MQYTTNYNLNQWEAADRVTRADFNADNAAIDAALKAIAGGTLKVAAGSYTGTNQCGAANANSITCGFAPKLVIVAMSNGGLIGIFIRPCTGATPAGASAGYDHLSWRNNGVSWYCDSYADVQLNRAYEYHWIAFG